MEVFTLMTLLACVVLFNDEVSPSVWNMPVYVKGYESYLDVTPVKYNVPPGTSKIILTIQTGRSNDQCPPKTIDILIQHGGLPLVIETNLTFPNNFLVGRPDLIHKMEAGDSLGFSIIWPPPGPWYIIAYTEKTSKAIKQKGLNGKDTCFYYFIPSMDYDIPVKSTVIDYKEKHEVTIGYEGTLFSFKVPATTMSFKVQLIKCDPSPCNLTLTYLPYEYANTQTCKGSPADCVMHVASPSLMHLQYLEMKHEMGNQSQRVTFSILVTECSWKKGGLCMSLPELDRAEFSRPFKTGFGYINKQNSLTIDLLQAPFIAVPFEILDPNDIGGTLKWTMICINHSPENKIIVQICGALLHNYLPDITNDFDLCTNVSDVIRLNFTENSAEEYSLYVPYPKGGIWNIMLHADCFDGNNGSETQCPSGIYLQMYLNIQSCMDDGCSDKGDCMTASLNADLVLYSACQCDAKYQGYACTDDTNAQSVSVQLAGAYLLTMSNLFFAPAIVIAVRRRYFVEALVYFYNMFFSTFYHACDGVRLNRYRLCITKYDILQIGDFFGSACSLWFTLIAMACIRYQPVIPVLQILGPFCLLIGVVYDKTSLYIIVVPIVCGLVVIVASWGHKMYKRKKLYPSWRRYVFFLLPALVLAGIGASVFSFFETEDNYKYVHSVWHMCIALSICLFLPPRRCDDCNTSFNESNMSSELLTSERQSTMENVEETNAAYVNDTP